MGVIVCAVDGSAPGWEALDQALALARRSGDLLVAVTVWRALQSDFGIAHAASVTLPKLLAAERDHAESVLRRAGESAQRAGVALKLRLETGDPATEICALAARLDARLIAMGTQGHGALVTLLIGSVSSAVIRHAPCPVLVARAPSRESRDATGGTLQTLTAGDHERVRAGMRQRFRTTRAEQPEEVT